MNGPNVPSPTLAPSPVTSIPIADTVTPVIAAPVVGLIASNTTIIPGSRSACGNDDSSGGAAIYCGYPGIPPV